MMRRNEFSAFPVERVGYSEGMGLDDYFAIHAGIADVMVAEETIITNLIAAGTFDTDPLTVRCRARYAVAERMIRVRGEV